MYEYFIEKFLFTMKTVMQSNKHNYTLKLM